MSEETGKVDQSKSNSVQEFSTDLLRVYYGELKLMWLHTLTYNKPQLLTDISPRSSVSL